MLSNLKDLYKSATLKLTAFYLAMLMVTSILFSVIIYQVALSEVSTRLTGLQTGVMHEQGTQVGSSNFDDIIEFQAHKAASNILVSLYYINISILIIGGFGSYFMARRTLRPIEKSHEAQSRFTSDASHELRTPLAIMKLEIESALHEIKHSKQSSATTIDSIKSVLESNLEEVNKLSVLSTTLLSLSRLEHQDLPEELIDLKAIIESNFTRLTKPYAAKQRHSIFLTVTPAGAAMQIYANTPSIEELCRILLDNALKYSPLGSLIEIEITKKRRTIELRITNGGGGIDPGDLDHIFDRFYRASTSRSHSSQKNSAGLIAPTGYGLGLALAKQIVTIHGGTIGATSKLGASTTLIVELPLE